MNSGFQFLIYNTPDKSVSVNVIVKDETIWMTQKAMSELFDVQIPAINKHLCNIFNEGELDQISTVSKMEIVQTEGRRMEDFSASINAFLAFRRFNILQSKGSVSKSDADTKAKAEYDIYNKNQKIISDFDREIKRLLDKGSDKRC